MFAYCTHTHTHTFLTRSLSAATPTSGRVFPPRGSPATCSVFTGRDRSSLMWRNAMVTLRLPPPAAIMPQTNLWRGICLSAVDPSLHCSPDPSEKRDQPVRDSHGLHREKFPRGCEYGREPLCPQQNTERHIQSRHTVFRYIPLNAKATETQTRSCIIKKNEVTDGSRKILHAVKKNSDRIFCTQTSLPNILSNSS